MKKLICFIALAMLVVATSCSGGYDQKKVDALDKDNLSKDDYYEMVKQVNYALDDAEAAKDINKWEAENKQEAESLAGMVLALGICESEDPDFPEDLRKDVKKIMNRFEKLDAGTESISFEDGVEVAEAYDDTDQRAIFDELSGDDIYICQDEDGGIIFLSLIPETGGGALMDTAKGKTYAISVERENGDRSMFTCMLTEPDDTPTGMSLRLSFDSEGVSGRIGSVSGESKEFRGVLAE